MRKFIVIPLFIILPILIISMYYFYNETNNSSWSMQCTFYHVTGLHCPGCGGQRALHYMLHRDFVQALRSNVLFVIFLPFFIYLYIILFQLYGLKKQKNVDNFFFSRTFGIIVLILTVLFVILRNIPSYPFTLLSPP